MRIPIVRDCAIPDLILASILLGLFGFSCGSAKEPPPWASLETILSESRPIEPQLSASSAWEPCVVPSNGPRALREPACGGTDSPAPYKPRVLVSRGGTDAATSASYAEALLRLVREQSLEAVEAAIQELESLNTERSSHDGPERYNDLAAAYYVRAQRGSRPADLVRALEAVEQSLEITELPAARFNQGLICNALEARKCAIEAWSTYRKLDPDSAWSEEAASHLDRLRTQEHDSNWPRQKAELLVAADSRDFVTLKTLVNANRREVSLWVEGELLPQGVAAAVSSASKELPRELLRAQALAATLEALGGDRLATDSLDQVFAVLKGSDLPARRNLASGLAAFAQAQDLFAAPKGRNYRDAENLFRTANHDLEVAGNPLALRAALGRASCLYMLTRADRVLQEVERVFADPRTVNYPSIRGRAFHLRGTTRLLKDQFSSALSDYQATLHEYQRIGLEADVNTLWARIAQIRSAKLGQEGKAWHDLYLGLSAFNNRDSGQSLFARSELVRATQAIGCYRAADRLLRDRSDQPRKSDEEVLYQLGLAKSSLLLGRSVLASEHVRRAREALDQGSAIYLDSLLRLFETEGQVGLVSQPLAAARRFQRAIELSREINYPAYLSRLYSQLAKALVAAGRRVEATKILAQAVSELEKQWRREVAGSETAEETLESSYFDLNREPIELLVELLADDGQAETAFAVSEIGRAREILALVSANSYRPSRERSRILQRARPLGVAEIRKRLSPGQTLISFSVRNDSTSAFVLDRKGLAVYKLAVGRAKIRAYVAELTRVLDQDLPENDLQYVLGSLFDSLIVPLSASVSADAALVFVPDGDLHAIPFSALYDRTRRRYLVEDHPIAIAPSATLLVRAIERDASMARTETPSVLAVGNPTFDTEVFPNLEVLHAAEDEAREIAKLYPKHVLVLADDATRKRVLSAARDALVVHLAIHAVTLESTTGPNAFLLLAPEGEADTGLLYAPELLRTNFGSTHLIFISACSSAGGQPPGAQGAAMLVRALLGAGVPAVVGTLWPIDDTKTPPLAKAFHRYLLDGDSAATAMQKAQLEFLHGETQLLRSARFWGGFEVIGSARLIPKERKVL